MDKKLESLNFNLTSKMVSNLLEFEKTKKKLEHLKKLYNIDKNNEDLFTSITSLEKKLAIIRKSFIKEFRFNNKKEIEEYLSTKNQN